MKVSPVRGAPPPPVTVVGVEERRHIGVEEQEAATGVPKKEIARRLQLDVKTVRRAVARTTAPVRMSPPRPSSEVGALLRREWLYSRA